MNQLTPLSLTILLAVIFFSRDSTPTATAVKTDSSSATTVATDNSSTTNQSTRGSEPLWLSTTLMNYIATSKSPLVVAATKQGIKEGWVIDDAIETDTANYMVIQIGHDVAEADGSEPRRVTDQWLYVDTLSRKIYEYDLPADSLVYWGTAK